MSAHLQPTRMDAATSRDEPRTFVPRADLLEARDAFTIVLDVPGVEPADVEITAERHQLVVSARATPVPAPQGYTLAHREFREGSFQRTFAIPEQVDAERIEAVLEDGVLRLTLPKASPPPAKKIAVKPA